MNGSYDRRSQILSIDKQYLSKKNRIHNIIEKVVETQRNYTLNHKFKS